MTDVILSVMIKIGVGLAGFVVSIVAGLFISDLADEVVAGVAQR